LAAQTHVLAGRRIFLAVVAPPAPEAQSASGVDAPLSTFAHVLDRGAQAGAQAAACGDRRSTLVPSMIVYRKLYIMYSFLYKHVALLTGHSSSRCINHFQQPGFLFGQKRCPSSHPTMVSIEHDHDELQHVKDDASFKVIDSLRRTAIKCVNQLLTLDNMLHCELGIQRWTGAS
jgi:hypothetical protein